MCNKYWSDTFPMLFTLMFLRILNQKYPGILLRIESKKVDRYKITISL